MAKITRNYVLEVLKPVDEETIKKFRAIKQDRNEMEIIQTDIMRLELSLGLVPLVDEDLKHNLLERIKAMRRNIEKETGISIPPIRIRDNAIDLSEFEYSFYIRGRKMVQYKINHSKYLCISDGTVKNKIDGKEIKDPTFGAPAILINKNKIKEAAEAGYTVVDAPSIIMTNLEFLIKENISEIFTYDGSIHLLKKVGETNPFLIEYCFSKYRPIELKEILHMMLKRKKNLLDIDKIIELLIFLSEKERNIENIKKIILKNFENVSASAQRVAVAPRLTAIRPLKYNY
jgi:flagellar biosynthesis protein FlhA